MNVLFWGPGEFPVSFSNRDTSWNAWNHHSGRFWSTRRFYSAIWSFPLTNVKWHSDPWPTMTSKPIRLSTNFMTLIPSLTSPNYEWFPRSICNGFAMPSWNAYPSGHLVSSQIFFFGGGGLHGFWLLRTVFPNYTPMSMYDLYAERDLHQTTTGFHEAFATGVKCQQGEVILLDCRFHPPFWDLLVLQLLRPDFSNLPCIYSTFHIEYFFVPSRYWLKLDVFLHNLILKRYYVKFE